MKTLRSLALLAPLTFLGACGSSADHDEGAHAAAAAEGDHDDGASEDHDMDGDEHGAQSAGHDADGDAHDDGEPGGEVAAAGLWSLGATTLDGEPVELSDWSGKVALVVNVASECGYTPQYAGLQALHEDLAERGFVVLGFPSNEFGGQEPGSAEQIQQFCQSNYGVTFPMFAKCRTGDGDGQSDVYALLQESTGELPNWNFCKYLVGRDGEVLGFYRSNVAPQSEALRADIERALGA